MTMKKRPFLSGILSGLLIAGIIAIIYPYISNVIGTILQNIPKPITKVLPYMLDFQGYRFYVTSVQTSTTSEGFTPWIIELTVENIAENSQELNGNIIPLINGVVDGQNYTYYGEGLDFHCRCGWPTLSIWLPPGIRLRTRAIIPVAVTAKVHDFALMWNNNKIGSILLSPNNDYEPISTVAEKIDAKQLGAEVDWIDGSTLSLDWVDIHEFEDNIWLFFGITATNPSGQSISIANGTAFLMFSPNGGIFSFMREISANKPHDFLNPGEVRKQIWIEYGRRLDEYPISRVRLQSIYVELIGGNLRGNPPTIDKWVIYYVPIVQEYSPEIRITEYEFYEPFIGNINFRDGFSPEMQERIKSSK